MDPYFVLGVGLDADDAQVEAHYRALLPSCAPDVAPERFAVLRAAYDALRTPEGRVEALLFRWDGAGTALKALPDWLSAGARQPLRPAAVLALARDVLG